MKELTDTNADIPLLFPPQSVCRPEKKDVSEETSGYRRHENANPSGLQTLIICTEGPQSPFSPFREELESVLHQLPRR